MRRYAALLACASLLAAVPARAEEKRPVPDYDGRGGPTESPARQLLWIPRIIFFPAYLVTQYVVRYPTGALLRYLERHHIQTKVEQFFNHPAGLVPLFYFDLSFNPRAGLYFWANEVGVKDNQIRASGSFWTDYGSVTATDRYNFGGGQGQLAVRGQYTARSDTQFFGLGPESRSQDQSRYQLRRSEVSAGIEWMSRRHTERIRAEMGWRILSFGDGTCCGDPSVRQQAEANVFPLPPGFAEGGYSAPYGKLRLVADTRTAAPETGVATILEAELGGDPSRNLSWLRSSATVGGSLDLTGHRRVLSLILNLQLADPIGDDGIPFTEQVSMGGGGALTGFGAGRLIDRSAVSLSTQYEWPIWAFMVGSLHLGVGNVFGPHLDGFAAEKLRLSTTIGMRTTDDFDFHLELLVGFGTEPLANGLNVDFFRIAVGGVTSF